MTKISRTPEYAAIVNVIHRCTNPNHAAYHNYGERGITVDPIFLEGNRIDAYHALIAMVGQRPSSEYSLERIDNDKGYIRGNIKWATRKEQQNNLRSNLPLWKRELAKEAIKLSGLKYCTVMTRIKRGITDINELIKPTPRVGGNMSANRDVAWYQDQRQQNALKYATRKRRDHGNREERDRNICRDWDAQMPSRELEQKYGLKEAQISKIARGLR